MPKLKFTPKSKRTLDLDPHPTPARLHTPKWYSDAPKFNGTSGSTNDFMKHIKSDDPLHLTFKLCIPFLDPLISGYMITLPTTIVVANDENEYGEQYKKIFWNTEEPPIDVQSSFVIHTMPIPEGFNAQPYRWANNWKIETPSGYSALFTHPFNRFDLPFYTLTGIVDTDKHPNSLLFPFFIKEDFEGEIPVGTPIAQVFPFKREIWSSEVTDKLQPDYSLDAVKQTFIKTYKKKFWSRKEYN
jgi:hypothetical protein